MVNKKLGLYLKVNRRNKSLSIRRTSINSGVSRSAILNMDRGTFGSLECLKKYAETLGLEVILKGEKEIKI